MPAPVAAPDQPAAPQSAMIAPKPSLMDHTMALRQEVAEMLESAQCCRSMGQVVDAVGQCSRSQLYANVLQQQTDTF